MNRVLFLILSREEESLITSAVLIGLNTDKRKYDGDEISLEELSLLAKTAGLNPKVKLLHRRGRIDPAYYIGSGKAGEVRTIIAQNGIEAVVFDFEPSPVQMRNLERLIKCRIISRTELILVIFEKRARTKDAQLQVELATLLYSLPRLRHMWTHLNRIAATSDQKARVKNSLKPIKGRSPKG